MNDMTLSPSSPAFGSGRPAATRDDLSVLAGRRVLLVEDEAFVAMDIQFALQDAGAQVVGPCASLSATIAAARDGGFDAAILDIDLGGNDVFPAADILRDADVPFVFHTGHGQRRELIEDYPDAPVCKKPVGSDRLLNALAAIV